MKYALTIGVDRYDEPGNDLAGCVNDALDWAAALRARGFSVVELHNADATGQNVRAAIGSMVATAKTGDTVVLVNSSHGSRVRDVGGDEPDRFDEVLCPHDVFSRGPILDDEIDALLRVRRFGVHVVFLPDSCYSGTLQRAVGHPMRARDAAARFLPPELFADAMPRRQLVTDVPARRRPAAVLLAACREDQVAWEAEIGGRRNGAFTRAALDALALRPRSYRAWLAAIRRRLAAGRFDQEPQLQAAPWQRWRRVL